MKLVTRSILGLLAPFYCAFLLFGCVYLSHDEWPAPSENPTTQSLRLELPKYTLEDQQAPDFRQIKPIRLRKQAFLDFLKPLIERENRYLDATGTLLAELSARHRDPNQTLTPHQLALLDALADRFSVTTLDLEKRFAILDRRVRSLPTAMVLAQAATESAWGTSRFAREGNNYFGQWCFAEGCGLVPKERAEGARHEVAIFSSPAHSIRAYFHNINSFSAYRDLRAIRQHLYQNKQPVTARALLAGLKKYSERGEHYVSILQKIVDQNHLESAVILQEAKLKPSQNE